MIPKKKVKGKTQVKSLSTRICEHRQYYVLLAPALIFIIIFCYVPMYGATVAFKNYSSVKGILGSPWVVVSGIMFNILSTDGIMNTIIQSLGGDPVKFLAYPKTFKPIVVLSQI